MKYTFLVGLVALFVAANTDSQGQGSWNVTRVTTNTNANDVTPILDGNDLYWWWSDNLTSYDHGFILKDGVPLTLPGNGQVSYWNWTVKDGHVAYVADDPLANGPLTLYRDGVSQASGWSAATGSQIGYRSFWGLNFGPSGELSSLGRFGSSAGLIYPQSGIDRVDLIRDDLTTSTLWSGSSDPWSSWLIGMREGKTYLVASDFLTGSNSRIVTTSGETLSNPPVDLVWTAKIDGDKMLVAGQTGWDVELYLYDFTTGQYELISSPIIGSVVAYNINGGSIAWGSFQGDQESVHVRANGLDLPPILVPPVVNSAIVGVSVSGTTVAWSYWSNDGYGEIYKAVWVPPAAVGNWPSYE